MKDLSEKSIREDCPHCNPNSFALKHPLKETDRFWVVCDVHPLVEGHILIIPKHHLSCVGEYDDQSFKEFEKLYKTFSDFVKNTYGSVSSFEHGKVGQTVFHSHVHLMPFVGEAKDIVPEGDKHLNPLRNIKELKEIFNKDGQYLFFTIGEKMWTVDLSLGAPRFFRDRFANAHGVSERGNWKEMHNNEEIMKAANQDIKKLKNKWKKIIYKYEN